MPHLTCKENVWRFGAFANFGGFANRLQIMITSKTVLYFDTGGAVAIFLFNREIL